MRTFWNDSMRDAALADVGGEIAAAELLDFACVTMRVGMMQSGVKMRAMSVNFQLIMSMATSRQTMVLGSLTRSDRPSLQEVVERGAVGLDAADEFVGRGFLEVIERERADLAEGVALDVVGDALAAPGEEIAAAVAEHAAQQRRRAG